MSVGFSFTIKFIHMNAEQQNPEGAIDVELSEEIAEGIYANLAMIAHSNSEFILDFIRMMPGVPKAKVKSVLSSPPNTRSDCWKHFVKT